MTKLEPLVTKDDFLSILKKNTFHEKDISVLASFTFFSLPSRFSGLSSSEANEVYLLEAKNMYYLLSAIRIALGLDEQGLQALLRLPGSQLRNLINSVDTQSHDTIEKTRGRFVIISKFIVANGDMKLVPKFQGKIPAKAFSFRQTEADSWFAEVGKFYIGITSEILIKGTPDLAQQYIFAAIAWYMNMSQSFKYYPKSTDAHLGDSIANMLIEFIQAVNGDKAYVKSVDIAPLYKDL